MWGARRRARDGWRPPHHTAPAGRAGTALQARPARGPRDRHRGRPAALPRSARGPPGAARRSAGGDRDREARAGFAGPAWSFERGAGCSRRRPVRQHPGSSGGRGGEELEAGRGGAGETSAGHRAVCPTRRTSLGLDGALISSSFSCLASAWRCPVVGAAWSCGRRATAATRRAESRHRTPMR